MLHSTSNRPIHGGNLAWAATIAGCSPASLLDFSASINPLGPPDSVLGALQGAISAIQHYPSPQYADLRKALGQYHPIAPNWVLPGNGAAELLTWAARDMGLSPNPQVYLPTPAFNDYQRAFRSFGVTVIPWPLLTVPAVLSASASGSAADEWPAIDLQVERLIQSSPPTASCLINNPHNPTGHLFTVPDLLPLLDHFSLVVVDEAFMDFLSPAQAQSLVPWVMQYPNLVVVRSLTKFYTLPGLRIGYAIGHPDRLQRWQQWRDPWPVNALAAVAAIAAVADTPFQSRTWDWLPPTRQTLLTGLADLPGLHPLPAAANYLLVKTATSVPRLQESLLKQSQVLIRDCLSFAELGEHYFRVAVRSEAENERLLTALREVQAL